MTDNSLYTSSSPAALVNFAAALDFLTQLDPHPDALFCFQTFDESRGKSKRRELTRVLHATRAQLPLILPQLARLNEMGAGIFITVNVTDGRGRKGTNIIRVRALFIDLDGGDLAPVIASKQPPHIVVATSPGKFHCYWLITDVAVEQFQGYQDALIERFGSDPSANSKQFVMRVPGFLHRKSEPFLVHIHSTASLPLYHASEFARKEEPEHIPSANNSSTTDEDLDTAVNTVTAAAALLVIPPAADHSFRVKIGMATHSATKGSETGLTMWKNWLARGAPATWSTAEARRRWQGFQPHSLHIGTLIYEANLADPDWRNRFDNEQIQQMERACRDYYDIGLYEMCAVANPDEQIAGVPLIKRPAPLVDEPPRAQTATAEPQGETTAKQTTTAQAEPQAQTQQQSGSTAEQTTTTAVPPPRTTTPTSRYYELVCAADIVPRAKTYLWQGHLLRGALELLTGMSDLGKSQTQIRMVASITTGQKWPDGTAATVRGNVIMVTAEDTLDQDMVPRLLAVGADLHRVFFLKKIKRDKLKRMFLLSEDLEILRLMIKDIGDVLAVMADPITAFMGKVDSHRATDVRGQLGPLADMSEETQTAFSAVTHPSKNAGPRALNHFIGSQAFIAAARIGHLCIEELDDEKEPTGRVLFTNPRNSSGKMPTLAYRKVVIPVGHDPVTGAVITASHVVFEDQPVGISADQALAAAAAPRTEGSPATEFLTMILNNEPLAAAEVFRQARDAGFSRDQLKRAKEKLNVQVTKTGFNEGWVWALPPM